MIYTLTNSLNGPCSIYIKLKIICLLSSLHVILKKLKEYMLYFDSVINKIHYYLYFFLPPHLILLYIDIFPQNFLVTGLFYNVFNLYTSTKYIYFILFFMCVKYKF